MEKIQTPFLPEELGTSKITTLIPAAGLNAEEFTPQLPIQKLDTKEITPLIPTQETETEAIMPLIPTDKSDTEEMTPSIPTTELNLEECAPPIPTEDFESKESSSRVLTEEVDTTGISPPIPSEELDREEIIAAIATEEKYHSENIIPQVDTEELDTEELTTDETKETNHSKSDDNINELDTIEEIHEFVNCLTDINQGEYSEQLSESKDVGAEDDLEDLATNQGENKASEVDSQLPVSMAEHEGRDGGKRYLVESAKQPQVEDHIPVVDELQRSSDILDNTTNLHEGVTAESIINAPEPETIDHTDHKETDPQQNTLQAATIHLEEQKVKVTSHNFPAAYMEDLEPTTEILSEPILNSVDVSGAQTEALALQQGSVQLDEDEMLSKKVVSELKEMTQLLTDISIEPENKDGAKEPVETSTDEIEAVQATLLAAEKVEPDKKTVAGLPQDKAIVAPEIESIQEQQILVATPKTQFESDIADVQHDELKGDIHGEDPPGEEVKDDNVPLLETDAEETAKDQKTINDTQMKFVQEDKDIEGRDLSVKAEDIPESILAQETLIAEAKYRPAPLTEDELVSADQQAKSDLSPEQEVVQETCAKSDEHKEIREDIHAPKTMTEECGEEMVPQLQTIIESAKDDEVAVGASEIERGKEIEETQSKQSIQTDSVVAEETINAEIQITEELKEETMQLTEVQAESNQKTVDVTKTEPNADQVMAEEGKATTEDIADKRKVSVEVKEEVVALSEMNVDPQEKDDEAVNETDNVKMSEVLASEEANVELFQSEETTEGSLVEESLPSELKEGAEPMSELTLQPGNINMKQVTVLTEGTLAKKSDDNQNEAMKSSAETEALLAVRDEVQEPEEVPAVETETVEEVATPGLEITQQSITQTFSKETLEEEIPKSETEREIVSEVEQTKAPPDQALDKQKNLEPEITVDDRPQDAKEGEEDGTLQVTEAHISLHQEGKKCAQSLENVIFEEIPDVCGTLADKVKLEARASDVENRTTGENCDLPNVEVTIATGEYALVTQVTMCRFKEVSTALPDRIRAPSCMQEPLMGSVVPESTETAVNELPIMTDDLAEMARISNEAVMMHVPATVMEANHSIQVQVVQMETTAAERSLDHMSEIEIREKGFIDIGNRNIEGVEFVSASLGVEDVMHEDYAVMCHEIAPHVKDNQLETLRQKVLKGAINVELGKVDGNMELLYTEHACKGETLEEALHEEATPQSLEVPKFQKRLEEKEDSNWAPQAEESMAATDKAGEAPVAKEEPCIPKNRHKDTETTKEGHQTFVVQSSFHQMEPADSQKEKNPIEKGVQPQEALSQTDLGEYQDVMTNEEDFQIPKVEEPLSQRGTEEPLSLLDPLASLKTTEQSEVSVQAILALDSVVSVDNHKQTGISEENVEVQQTVKPSFPKEPDGKQKSAALTKKSCQKPKTEEPVLKKESTEDQKQTDLLEKHVQASKNQEPLTQKESIDTQKQVEVTKEHEQARDVQVPSPQKESIEIQKQTELQDKYFQASETQEPISQKQSSESKKQTELQDKLVQASENKKPLPQKEYTETQKLMGLQDKYFQASETQDPIAQNESTERQKQRELQDKLVQASENEKLLPQKEYTETQKQMGLTEEHEQARDIQVASLQKESTETQKETELKEKLVQAGENEEPLPQKESTEIQQQMELQVKLVQASENEKLLLQKEYTETQKQRGLKEEAEHARDIQVASLQKESTETQKETELKEKLVQAGENEEPLPQKESTEIQQQMELQVKLVQASENEKLLLQKEYTETQKQRGLKEEAEHARDIQVASLQKESTETQKETELKEKLVQAGENEEPLPQKEYTETQKQRGLKEEAEHARDIQVASLQKGSTETQKETELKEKLVQAGENQEPLPQKESSEIQQQMELKDKLVQASENQEPLPQKMSTKIQQQMELQENYFQASETQEPIAQKESNETQKQMNLTEEHEQARDVQV
ncbi:centrosome-associated protein CEP250-like, partial [Hippocampus comes]|uniref:centrosome-associated protein CEP250-like n=1 Tax=Hippocampus comes TaxID=109280 RepID=UPI00094E510B